MSSFIAAARKCHRLQEWWTFIRTLNLPPLAAWSEDGSLGDLNTIEVSTPDHIMKVICLTNHALHTSNYVISMKCIHQHCLARFHFKRSDNAAAKEIQLAPHNNKSKSPISHSQIRLLRSWRLSVRMKEHHILLEQQRWTWMCSKKGGETNEEAYEVSLF